MISVELAKELKEYGVKSAESLGKLDKSNTYMIDGESYMPPRLDEILQEIEDMGGQYSIRSKPYRIWIWIGGNCVDFYEADTPEETAGKALRMMAFDREYCEYWKEAKDG